MKNNTEKFYKAKKNLGQNFLKSKSALREIIKAGEIKKTDIILEIGPGKGALTSELLKTNATIVAIEKDQELFELLSAKFQKEIKQKKLILKNEDILKYNTKDFILNKKYKIIANIPYNITGAIFKKFLTEENQPNMMVLMVQYEIAKRIMAQNKKESLLSLSVKAYGNPKMISKVPARYFSPAPKVDSAIIKISDIKRNFFENKKVENKFWEILHIGFAHKRKVLIGNLKKYDKKTNWEEIFKKINISNKLRAEDLTLIDWKNLINELNIVA